MVLFILFVQSLLNCGIEMYISFQPFACWAFSWASWSISLGTSSQFWIMFHPTSFILAESSAPEWTISYAEIHLIFHTNQSTDRSIGLTDSWLKPDYDFIFPLTLSLFVSLWWRAWDLLQPADPLLYPAHHGHLAPVSALDNQGGSGNTGYKIDYI